MPLVWSSAVILPLHKKRVGNTNFNNYPVIVGKILEKRTRAIVESLLDENQAGFRPMRRCQDQMFCTKQMIGKVHEGKNNFYGRCVDLQKAYRCMPRSRQI